MVRKGVTRADVLQPSGAIVVVGEKA
eukprot:COSAG02_NODE_34665_length_480_cov_1.154856_1_plen_25_part_01